MIRSILSTKPTTFDAVGRFLVPRDVPEACAYFVHRLFVSHGRSERVRRALAAAAGPSAARALLAAGGLWLDIRTSRLEGQTVQNQVVTRWRGVLPLLRVLSQQRGVMGRGPDPVPLHRSILLRDYSTEERGRLLAFPFLPGEGQPAAVVKVRASAAPGPTLGAEKHAIETVRERMEEAIRATVPEVLGFHEDHGVEILALSHVEGRSAYRDQQNLLLPARAVKKHMRAAATWLAAFHRSMGIDARTPRGPMHGDYWSRNVLVGSRWGRLTARAVVDWEHFRSDGWPVHDLFHFPVTYGLNQPERGVRGRDLPAAFRRTFLEASPMAKAVEAYCARYCRESGLDPAALPSLLELYLALREASSPTAERGAWAACRRALHEAWPAAPLPCVP